MGTGIGWNVASNVPRTRASCKALSLDAAAAVRARRALRIALGVLARAKETAAINDILL
jgi:hypothetical protein